MTINYEALYNARGAELLDMTADRDALRTKYLMLADVIWDINALVRSTVVTRLEDKINHIGTLVFVTLNTTLKE